MSIFLSIVLSNGSRLPLGASSPPTPVSAFVMHELRQDGGGTHNAIAFSPDGNTLAAFADVGGTRHRTGSQGWRYLPTLGDNASRQVAGGCATDDGKLFQIAGNGTSAGVLQEIDIATGAAVELVSGLYVGANRLSDGDSGPRPRPVGWMVTYDKGRDLVYYCTEKGVGRYNRTTSTDDGIIALPDESCRGFSHREHAIVISPGSLEVCTHTQGMQRIDAPHAGAAATRISPAAWDRFEDAAILDDDGLLCAGHEDGVLLIRSDGSTLDVTPSQNSGTGASGGTTRWIAVAVQGDMAALGMINPDGPEEWIYRHTDVSNATAATWDNATPTEAVLQLGSTYLSPANRVLGASAGSGPDLVGTNCLAFDPSDPTGNTLHLSLALSLYRTTNFAGSASAITYESDNEGLSMVSMAASHIDGNGTAWLTMADHNVSGIEADGLLTDELHELSVSGISDGWGLWSAGSGTDNVVVFSATSDRDAFDPGGDIYYRRGTSVTDGWVSTGFADDFRGQGSTEATGVPRVGGVFGWDRGDGTHRFVGWADGLGFVYSDYTLASDSWGTWQVQSSGPTSGLVSANRKSERDIRGASDGSVIFGIQLIDGQLWRSLNGGVDWTKIASSLGTDQEVRVGRIDYLEAADVLIYSDENGLHKIANASTSADVVTISGITTPCQVAVDSAGRAYAHVRGPGLSDLLRWDDFASATSASDATQIATDDYRSRVGDLATCMTIGTIDGTEYGLTGYSGSGAAVWTVPA